MRYRARFCIYRRGNRHHYERDGSKRWASLFTSTVIKNGDAVARLLSEKIQQVILFTRHYLLEVQNKETKQQTTWKKIITSWDRKYGDFRRDGWHWSTKLLLFHYRWLCHVPVIWVHCQSLLRSAHTKYWSTYNSTVLYWNALRPGWSHGLISRSDAIIALSTHFQAMTDYWSPTTSPSKKEKPNSAMF